jgi:hypothetical protein
MLFECNDSLVRISSRVKVVRIHGNLRPVPPTILKSDALFPIRVSNYTGEIIQDALSHNTQTTAYICKPRARPCSECVLSSMSNFGEQNVAVDRSTTQDAHAKTVTGNDMLYCSGKK